MIPEKEHGIKNGIKACQPCDHKRSKIFCLLFFKLLFKNWKEKVKKMNAMICSSPVKCQSFTEKEFLTGLGIMTGAAEFAKRCSDLFFV